VARPSAKQLARIRKLPLSEAKFKKDSGMLPGMRLWGEKGFSLLERMWTRPARRIPRPKGPETHGARTRGLALGADAGGERRWRREYEPAFRPSAILGRILIKLNDRISR
jgi:hypothetical protein